MNQFWFQNAGILLNKWDSRCVWLDTEILSFEKFYLKIHLVWEKEPLFKEDTLDGKVIVLDIIDT